MPDIYIHNNPRFHYTCTHSVDIIFLLNKLLVHILEFTHILKKSNNTLEEIQKRTTLSEQFQKSIPLTHKYMTAHLPGFVQALQLKVVTVN